MISVIVPVYNVRPYLVRCLDSILSQTFRDLEIILVDDGSTDGSSEICDDYCKKDGRIRVIHTENHGLSAARNLGIEMAAGEWIMFVDSDDRVSPDFCRLPLENAEKEDADLAVFDMTIIDIHGNAVIREPLPKGIISAEAAVEHGYSAVWNKLYHKTLFSGIRYPVGQIAEDTATTHKLVYKAGKIVCLDDKLYYYQKRKGSISETKDEVLYRDLYKANLQKADDLRSFGFPEEKLQQRMLRESLRLLMHISPSDDPLYRRAYDQVSSWEGSTDGLKVHERNAFRVLRFDKRFFHSYCIQRGWRADPAGNMTVNDENKEKE